MQDAMMIQMAIDMAALQRQLDQADAVMGKGMQQIGRDASAALNQVGTQGAASLNKVTVSAAQTAAALRGLPAQITDIVTSLQGGQKPLTVLMQQGGQIKDMFGGVGNAVQGVAGYLGGLVTPLAVIAVAASALAFGFAKGADESKELELAMVRSHGVIGQTTGQIKELAKELTSTGYSRGALTEALMAVGLSGVVAADQLRSVTLLAVELERTGGQSIDKTVAVFKKLADEPAKASKELGDQLHYLTAAQYEQIRGLEEVGKKTDAARLAQAAYADAVRPSIDAYKANLGPLDTALEFYTKKGKQMWDALTGVGTTTTSDERIAKIKEQLAQLNSADPFKFIGIPDAIKATFDPTGTAARLKGDLQGQLDYLEKVNKAAQDNARYEAARQKTQADGIAVIDEVAKVQKQGLEKTAQMNLELEKYRLNIEKIKASDPASALLKPAAIAAGVKAIHDQFKDPAVNRDLSAQIEAVKQAGKVQEEVAKRTADTLQTSYKMGQLSEEEYLNASSALTLANLQTKEDALQSELKIAKSKGDSQKEVATLTGQIALIEEQKITEETKRENAYQLILYKRLRIYQDLRTADIEANQAATVDVDKVALDKQNAALAAARSYEKAIEDTAEQLKVEAQSLGLTNEQRTLGLNLFQVELERKRQLAALDGQLSDTAREKAESIINEAAAQARANAELKAQLDTTRAAVDSIESTAHSVWSNVLQGGQDAFTKIGNTIKSAILDMLYQLSIKPWIINVAANLTGSSGTASSLLGGSGNGLSLNNLSTLASLPDKYNTLSNAISSYFGAGAASTGGLGLSAGLGTGTTLASTSSGLGLTGGLGSGYGFSAGGSYGLSAGSSALGGSLGTSAAGVSTGVGAGAGATLTAAQAIPIVGAFIAAYGLITSSEEGMQGYRNGGAYTLDKDGKAQLTADKYLGTTAASSYTSGSDGNLGEIINVAAAQTALGGQLANDKVIELTTTATQTITELLKAFGSTKELTDYASGLASSNSMDALIYSGGKIGGTDFGSTLAKPAITGDNLTDQAAYKEYAAEVSRSILDALKVADLGGEVGKYVTSLGDLKALSGDAAAASVTMIATYKTFFELVKNSPYDQLKNLSVEAVTSLLNVSGGIEGLSTRLSSFDSNYLSDSERLTAANAQVTKAMADLGFSMPATRDGFKDLVQAQDLNTEAGRKSYIALLDVSDAFAQVSRATEAAAAEQQAWSDKLAILTGQTTQREIDERNALAGATNEATKALIRQYYAAQDSAAVLAAAAGWQDRLNLLLGKTTQREIDLRNDLTAATDEGTKALVKQYYAELDRTDALKQSQADIKQQLGSFDAASLTKMLMDAAFNPAAGMTAAQSFAQALTRSVEEALLTSTVGQIASAIFQAIIVPVSAGAAIDLATMDVVFNDAQAKLTALSTLFNDPKFQALLKNITDGVSASILPTLSTFSAPSGYTDTSAADKRASERANLEDQLNKLTKTSAELRAIERSKIDAANQSLFDSVKAREDANLKQQWQNKLDILLGKKTAEEIQLQEDLAGVIDAATKEIIQQVYAQNALKAATEAATAAAKTNVDKARAATDAAMATLQRSVDAQKKIEQAKLDAAQEAIDATQAVLDVLKSQITDLRGEAAGAAALQARQGQAFIDQALATAQATGYLPDSTALADAISAVRKGFSDTTYASKFESEKARLVLAGKLEQLQTIGGVQLTAAQQQLKAAQDALAALDKIIADAQALIDAVRGVDTSVMSVVAALQQLIKALAPEQAATATSTALSTGGTVEMAARQQELLKRNGTDFASINFKETSDALLTRLTAGSTYPNIFITATSAVNALQATTDSLLTTAGLVSKYLTLGGGDTLSFADRQAYGYGTISAEQLAAKYNIPQYKNGTNSVPADGFAWLHAFETVVPAGQDYVPPSFDYAPQQLVGNDSQKVEQFLEGIQTRMDEFNRKMDKANGFAERTATATNGRPEGRVTVKAKLA